MFNVYPSNTNRKIINIFNSQAHKQYFKIFTLIVWHVFKSFAYKYSGQYLSNIRIRNYKKLTKVGTFRKNYNLRPLVNHKYRSRYRYVLRYKKYSHVSFMLIITRSAKENRLYFCNLFLIILINNNIKNNNIGTMYLVHSFRKNVVYLIKFKNAYFIHPSSRKKMKI